MDISHAAIENRLACFRQRCTGLGLALTPQRLAIYKLLASDDSHPAAEEIYRRLKPSLPSLSLGTVYRTLELLESHELIQRVPAFSEQAHFDANLEKHHHLICVHCHRIIDFQDERLQKLPMPETGTNGFQIQKHRIDFLGLCQSCQANRR